MLLATRLLTQHGNSEEFSHRTNRSIKTRTRRPNEADFAQTHWSQPAMATTNKVKGWTGVLVTEDSSFHLANQA